MLPFPFRIESNRGLEKLFRPIPFLQILRENSSSSHRLRFHDRLDRIGAKTFKEVESLFLLVTLEREVSNRETRGITIRIIFLGPRYLFVRCFGFASLIRQLQAFPLVITSRNLYLRRFRIIIRFCVKRGGGLEFPLVESTRSESKRGAPDEFSSPDFRNQHPVSAYCGNVLPQL